MLTKKTVKPVVYLLSLGALVITLSACSLGQDNLNKKPTANAAANPVKYAAGSSPDSMVNATLLDRSLDYDGSISWYHWTLTRAEALTELDNSGNKIAAARNSRELLSSAILTRPNQKDLQVSVHAQRARYYFKLEVIDNEGASDNDEIILDVFPNDAADNNSYTEEWSETSAAISAGPDLRVNANDNVQLSAYNFNLSGDINYQWQILDDAGLSFSLPQQTNQASLQFTAPNSSSASAIRLSLSATVGAQTYSDEVVINILVDQGPTISPIASQIAHAGDEVLLHATASGDNLQYQWRQIAGASVTLQDATLATARFIAPTLSQQSILRFNLEVTDGNNAKTEAVAEVTVLAMDNNTNQPPTVTAGTPQTVAFGASVTQKGSANDSDGQVASYAWTQLSGPTVSLTGADTDSVSFNAPADIANRNGASIRLQLTATDNLGASNSAEVTITMQANRPPTVNAGVDQVVSTSANVSLNGSASDPDNNLASQQWTQISGTTTTLSQANTLQPSFTAPAVSQQQQLVFRLVATDSVGAFNQDTVTITVNPSTGTGTNQPPLANAGADIQAISGQTVQLQGTAIDNDGSISSIQWKWLAGTPVTLVNSNQLSASFQAPIVTQSSSVSLQLQVTDDQGASASDVVLVTINPPNVAPTVSAGADRIVASGSVVNVSAQAADSDGVISTYSWSQISGPSITLTPNNQADTSFNAPVVSANTDIVLQVQVTDNSNASASDQIIITVSPNNIPPQAVIQAPSAISEGNFIELDGRASVDSDGSIQSYLWELLPGSASVTLSNSALDVASFIAPATTQALTLDFQLTVTDNQNASNSTTHQVTVYPLVTLSGNITVNSANLLDGDINQTGSVVVANDSISSAQHLSNPMLLGGYVNQAGAGPAGRSQVSGDPDDYYHITLNAGQTVSLSVGDAQAGVNELELYLLEEAAPNNVVDASLGGTNLESVSAVNAGGYFVRVTAKLGASNYILSSGGSTVLQRNGWSLRDDFVAGDIILQNKPSVAIQTFSTRVSAQGLSKLAGAPGRNQLFRIAKTGTVTPGNTLNNLLNTPTGNTGQLISADPALQTKLDTLLQAAQLRRDPSVQSVALNYRLYPSAIPNDANYPNQWDYTMMNLESAWDSGFGSSNVIVAVIDTGILPNHPDFAGRLLPGYDFIRSASNANDGDGLDNDPTDPGDGNPQVRSDFHGTHVAGTVAAATNNGIGVAGVAGGVMIMPLRVIGINGATSYDVEQAIRYAAGLANDSNTVPNQIADVINLSLGGAGVSTTAPTAYRLARSAGVIIVAAAGNDGTSQISIPAAYDGVVSVSAVTISRTRAAYSNFGATIDVAAPGGSGGDINNDGLPDAILSLGANDLGASLSYEYNFKAGTSMASPHVAGVAALMKSAFPDLTPALFDTLLANGELTQDLGTPGRDDLYGYGLIDASRAVQAALTAGGNSGQPVNPPVLSVAPAALGFGVSLNSQTLSISNSGGGSLSISSVSASSAGNWLQVAPQTVDASGLGSYLVSVNRSGLSDNIYTGSLSISSNAGNQTVSVSMQVMSTAVAVDAGPQIIELINNSTGTRADVLTLPVTNGVYAYSFPQVSIGEYRIRSSSDLDNDGILCELGESCGAYPLLGSQISSTIVVDGVNSNLNNLDFPIGFDPNLQP